MRLLLQVLLCMKSAAREIWANNQSEF